MVSLYNKFELPYISRSANVFELTYFVSSGTSNLSPVSQSIMSNCLTGSYVTRMHETTVTYIYGLLRVEFNAPRV